MKCRPGLCRTRRPLDQTRAGLASKSGDAAGLTSRHSQMLGQGGCPENSNQNGGRCAGAEAVHRPVGDCPGSGE